MMRILDRLPYYEEPIRQVFGAGLTTPPECRTEGLPRSS